MTGDIDGFFLMCEDLGRMFDNIYICFLVLFVVFEEEISFAHTTIPLFMPRLVHNGSVS